QLRQPLYTEQRDYTRTQKLHYTPSLSTPSQKAATMWLNAAVPANCPHVLGMAGVGTGYRRTLNCLSRNIRSTILLAVPTHMALFFIF
ncbi:unnamed protein product, partial [Pleuronectes platessa]